jgi:Tfp pilus assembly PilM family ATPase
MAKLLALDWDPHSLRLIIANRHASKVTVEAVQVASLSGAMDGDAPAADAADALRRLLELLADTRFRGAEVFVTARRADVELRLLTLPVVPAEELPDIVRWQSMNESSDISEDWPVDFLTLETTDEQTSVLSAAISPKRMAEYRQILARAELRPKALVLRPTATALLVSTLAGDQRADVEICLEDLGRELELSVLRHGKPILIRTVQAPRSEAYDRITFLAQEVKRTALAARNQLHGDNVLRVVMFGADNDSGGSVGERLQEQLKMPVMVLDPFQAVQLGRQSGPLDAGQRGQFAAAIGLLIGTGAEGAPLIDFLNPRKYEPPQSRRQMAIMGAVASLLLLLAGAGGFYLHLRSLDAQTRELQLRIQNRRRQVTTAEERLAEVAAVAQWQRGDINWLAQLRDVSANIPASDRAQFSRWQADVLSDGNGQLILEGLVDKQQTIGQIDGGLRSQQRRVRTEGGVFENRDSDYPWRFKQTITIQTPPAPVMVARTRPRPGRRPSNP